MQITSKTSLCPKREKQFLLRFPQTTENRAEKVERIMGGNLALKVKPASELHFDYQAATAIARRSNPTPKEKLR
jgi:hypothetical protein